MQSETVQDGTNQVGFFGKCQLHGNCSSIDLLDAPDPELSTPASGQETCARVEVLSFFFFITLGQPSWQSVESVQSVLATAALHVDVQVEESSVCLLKNIISVSHITWPAKAWQRLFTGE